MEEQTINGLPKGWKWVKLESLVDNPKKDLVDGPFGSNLKAHEYVEEGVPVFKIQNIKANRFLDKNLNFVTKEKAASLSRHSFKSGDIIITKLGDPLGLCCKVPDKYHYGIIVADLMRLRPSPTKIIDKYLINAINSDVVQSQFKTITKGTTRPRVNLTIVRDIKIPLPPKEIQHQIVSKIEELLSELDKGIEELKTAQQQLKVYRQAVLKWAFEGKLTNENVKDGALPEGWKLIRFGELFSETPQNGLYKPSSEYGSGVPIIRIDGFYDGIILNDYEFKRVKLTEEETKKYLLSVDDILVNRVNSMSHLGKCGLVKSLNEQTVFESNIMKVRVKKEHALPEYLTNYLSSKRGIKELTKNAKHAVNQASINQTDVSNTIIPICSIEEQQQIVQEIESRLSVCDKIEETITNSLKQAEALRQSILKKAFEGKLKF